MDKTKYTTDDLLLIMKKLRGENGCPWDRVQTHESIKECMVEESYEVIDALDKKDDKMMANELGDLLLQIVFHSQIASERGAFDFSDVTDEICKKLISRHNHVFGNDSAEDDKQVIDLWDKNKKAEKGLLTVTDSLKDVPASFPSLMRAQKVIKRAAKSDMQFKPDYSENDILDSVADAVSDIRKNILNNENPEENFKKLLMLTAAFASKKQLCAEILLKNAVDEFIEKFEVLEQVAQQK